VLFGFADRLSSRRHWVPAPGTASPTPLLRQGTEEQALAALFRPYLWPFPVGGAGNAAFLRRPLVRGSLRADPEGGYSSLGYKQQPAQRELLLVISFSLLVVGVTYFFKVFVDRSILSFIIYTQKRFLALVVSFSIRTLSLIRDAAAYIRRYFRTTGWLPY
jgi:hypothetical protein